ncbi:ulp1 protease family, C-terminal catalytic domain-containing protein [Artemisia annua]|uniref:Ulp1 protease family, C-terminal catalytic domain-containing protein n=1 Tax=Artemisia annua TaxID=35608 RepID=A0A2U1P857_ARTAN|nr:ulp1 protease family, C-terminal catalytic domain-containing protein [Artemisia annua]
MNSSGSNVLNMINVSEEEIVIPSTFYNPSKIFELEKRVQNTAWEENKNLAIVVFDDPRQYLSHGSSEYCSSQELIGYDEEIEFPEPIVDDMFTEDIDSFSNELEGIVHELKLVKKPLSSEKGLPLQKERHEVLVTETPLSSTGKNVGGEVRNVGGEVRNVCGKSVQDIRGTDKGKKKVGFQEQHIAIEGKREVKFSSSMTSAFYIRKVDVSIKLTEEEKKVIEYIWSTSNDGRGTDKGKKKVGFQEQHIAIEGKREVKFSSSMTSAFYIRKVDVSIKLTEEEKKVIEYIWSTSNDGSLVLNYEELKRDKLAGSGNLYCNTSMLPHYVLETGANEEKIRKIMDGNMKIVLKQACRKNLGDVHLVFFRMIHITKKTHHFYLICFNMKTVEIDVIDNINNNLEVLDRIYGPYANLVIKSFIEYMKREKHPKSDEFLKAEPKILQMEWRTNKNVTNCGVFVMRHMETYMGRGAFFHEFKKAVIGQLVQIKILRAKYLAKIVLMEINEVKENFLKEAEAYMKKTPQALKLVTHENINVPQELFERINERVRKVFSG